MAVQPSRFKRLLHTLLVLDVPHRHVDIQPIILPCRDLPAAFHMARVAVVSDVHLPDTLVRLDTLVQCVALQKPDAIFLTGDLTNSYTDMDVEGLRELATRLTAIAPCFAIPGNHELRLEREPLYREILTACGVHYLFDSYADWHKDGQTLRLYGMARRRPAPLRVQGQPSVVLAHKPQYFPYYQKARWDIVVCGHAHGGQIRFKDQALYAPGQGFFPTYTGGVYQADTTTMVVSRGIGNSSIPCRIGNRPHMPLLIFHADDNP